MTEHVIPIPGSARSTSMEAKPELEKELADIRKEVIESRNLVIKTDNLLKNIHAEVKEVGRRQKEFQTKQLISSAAAYVLFAVLAAGGAVWATTAATSGAHGERQRLEKAVADLTQQLDTMKTSGSADVTTRKAAAEVYRMMTDLPGDERLKGIDALRRLDTTRLSALEKQALTDRATALQRELGQTAFERGKAAFRRNDMQGTVEELNRFMAMNPPESEQLDASFFLGTALSQLRKHEQAVPYLSRFVNGDKRSKSRDYGMLLLAASYEQIGQPEKAVEVAREALATYPNSEFGAQLRSRLASAKRALAGPTAGGEATPPGGAPGGTPGGGTPGGAPSPSGAAPGGGRLPGATPGGHPPAPTPGPSPTH